MALEFGCEKTDDVNNFDSGFLTIKPSYFQNINLETKDKGTKNSLL